MQVQVKDQSSNAIDISISATEIGNNKDTSTVSASIHNTEVAVSNIATDIPEPKNTDNSVLADSAAPDQV